MTKESLIAADFGFGEDQEMLRNTARKLLDERIPVERLRKLVADDETRIYDEGERPGWDEALWKEIVELGFPVFTRHLSPTTGRSRLKVEAINVPVHIGGVGVAPGDIVVADGTGIVCLPRDLVAQIVERAEAFAADDAAAVKDLKAGLSFSEAMAKYKNI